MSQAYDNYVTAVMAYEEADEAADRLMREFSNFAQPLLSDWRRCYIELPGVAIPANMREGRQSVSAMSLSPPADLQRAMFIRFNALERVQAAWSALSDVERRNLIIPDWLSK
jgi:hypothetical protein